MALGRLKERFLSCYPHAKEIENIIRIAIHKDKNGKFSIQAYTIIELTAPSLLPLIPRTHLAPQQTTSQFDVQGIARFHPKPKERAIELETMPLDMETSDG